MCCCAESLSHAEKDGSRGKAPSETAAVSQAQRQCQRPKGSPNKFPYHRRSGKETKAASTPSQIHCRSCPGDTPARVGTHPRSISENTGV